MYEIFIANPKTEKRLLQYIRIRKDVRTKLERLKTNSRKELDAHPLHGRVVG